jgi:uncharacterized caspase-like protein
MRNVVHTALLALFCLAMAGGPSLADRRVALVMGNGGYQNTVTLPNALNDAPAVAAALRRLGFEVVEGTDLTHAQMNAKLKEFAHAVVGADVGLVFYAGHGMQVAGENYLVPIDAALKQQGDLEFEAVKVDAVLKQMLQEAKVKIVLLDACRDNPLAEQLARSMSPRSRSLAPASGLSRMEASNVSGTVIAFATAPGSIALDGKGSHSPFTEALLAHLETPDLDIDLVMKRVRGYVAKTTNDRQQPWTNSSLNGEFYLKSGAAGSTVAAAAATQAPAASAPTEASERVAAVTPSRSADPSAGTQDGLQVEFDRWQAAERAGSAEAYQAYLSAYPSGRFAGTAQRKISELSSAKAPAASPAVGDVKSARADANTERQLKLSSDVIRDLHTRLLLLGHDTGGVRGTFNKASRKALSSWQSQQGLVPTGFLNAGQVQLLTAGSQTVYDNWVKQGKPALAAADAADDGPSKSSSSNRRRGNGEGQTGARAARNAGELLGGAARGLIGRKLGF